MSKLAGRYSRGSREYEREKCKKDSLVFHGDDFVSKALDFCLNLEGKERKDKKKFSSTIFNYTLTIDQDLIHGFF